MNYISLKSCGSEDFSGFSVTLAVSGCSHMCKGCWAKDSWKSSFGQPFDETAYQTLAEALAKPFINNLVIQGGDGLFHKNVADTLTLCRRVKSKLPEKNIVLFTGYTYEQLQNDLLRQPILSTIDYLVDGKFERELSKNPPPFRGSSNQVIHKLENGVSVGQH